jgi:hypothetical protein
MSASPRSSHTPILGSLARAEPFRSAEEAWFWTMAALVARRDGARITAGKGTTVRPCEPDDVVKCLDRLYRQRRITLVHARIMRLWGERGMPPAPQDRADFQLWNEAMDRLEFPLRIKGIVAEAPAAPRQSAQILPFPGRRA